MAVLFRGLLIFSLLITASALTDVQVNVLTTDPAQTVSVTRVAMIPATLTVIEAAGHCPNCESWVGGQLTIPQSAMTVLGQETPKHLMDSGKKTQSRFQTKSAIVPPPSHLENGQPNIHGHPKDRPGAFLQCDQKGCKSVGGVVTQKTPARPEVHPEVLAWRMERIEKALARHPEAAKLRELVHKTRKLLLFGVDDVAGIVALGLVTHLQVEFDNYVSATNTRLDLVEQKLRDLQNETIALSLAIQQNALNAVLLAGITAMNTAITEIRLRALAYAEQHVKGLLAVQALQESLCIPSGIQACTHPIVQVPVQYNGTISEGTVLTTQTSYYGLIDDSWNPGLISILNFSNPCGTDPYLAARVEEATAPWGYTFFQAIVYVVWPNTAVSPIAHGYNCRGFQNGQCFISQALNTTAFAEGARRVALIDVGFENNAYWGVFARLAPLYVYNDKAAFLNAFTFNTYGFWGQTSSTFPPPVPPGCNIGNSNSEIYFPAFPIKSNGGTCLDPVAWNSFYTGSCPSNSIFTIWQAPFFPFAIPYPDSTFSEFPAFLGEFEQGKAGEVIFRTLGVSNETIRIFQLVQQQYFFFNNTQGISRSPLFLEEWITEDGRSLSEELIQQYQVLGLLSPYSWNPDGSNAPDAFPFSFIPKAVYLPPKVGDVNCYSDACVINRANYNWNGTQYLEPLYSDLIAPTTNPIACQPSYDCETVGAPAQQAGKTPVLCPLNSARCCNSAGFVCYISFNGTDSNGATVLDVLNLTFVDVQNIANVAAKTPPDFSFTDTQIAVNTITDLNAQIVAAIPHISELGGGIGLSGLGDVLTFIADTAVKAVDLVAKVAEIPVNALQSAFSFAGNLIDSFLAYLPIILVIVLFICIYPTLMKQCDRDGGGINFIPRRSRKTIKEQQEEVVGGEHSRLVPGTIHPAYLRP